MYVRWKKIVCVCMWVVRILKQANKSVSIKCLTEMISVLVVPGPVRTVGGFEWLVDWRGHHHGLSKVLINAVCVLPHNKWIVLLIKKGRTSTCIVSLWTSISSVRRSYTNPVCTPISPATWCEPTVECPGEWIANCLLTCSLRFFMRITFIHTHFGSSLASFSSSVWFIWFCFLLLTCNKLIVGGRRGWSAAVRFADPWH